MGIRIKRNLYMLRENWQSTGKEEKFLIANLCQVPSYISLTTGLDPEKISAMSRKFPAKTKKLLQANGYLSTA